MTTSPHDLVLGRLKNVRPGSKGQTAACPAHEDSENSLSIGEGQDGRVLLHCFAGCSVADIVQRLGLQMSDLFPSRTGGPSASVNDSGTPPVITVDSLARDKALPAEYLRSLGLVNKPRGVLIPYRLRDGSPAPRQRLRTALVAKQGSLWGRGQEKIVPYGLERIDEAVRLGFLILVEGESDCWTLWYYRLPALGIPGADMVDTLLLAHLEGILCIYLLQEPGKGGDTFVARVPKRLASIGWTGTLHVIRLTDAKDPNDLHKQNPSGFEQAFRAAVDSAVVIVTPVTATIEAPVAQEIQDTTSWPASPEPEAFYGLAGDLVRLVAPHSESDPVALLVQTMVAFGSVIGRNAHFVVEADRHFMNLFVVIVGITSKGRKGTSWSHVKQRFGLIGGNWTGECVTEGLSSGEGLIWAVRDPIIRLVPIEDKKTGEVTGHREKVEDPGIDDKRLLVTESEFASVLKVLNREGNTLSAIIRRAWDHGDLRSLTKNSPARATGAHVSIIGHITGDELRRHLSTTESGNGFANRFLWVCARRSRLLPEGGAIEKVAFGEIQKRLEAAVNFASKPAVMRRDEDARAAWRSIYPDLSEGHPGLLGAVTSRAEAQVTRLACLYALLDCSHVVGAIHLKAAMALWEYVEASARFIFGEALGDPLADEIYQALRSRPEGMTRTEIRDLFGRNRGADQIGRALSVLAERGLAQCVLEESGGRPVERWIATRYLPPPSIDSSGEEKE